MESKRKIIIAAKSGDKDALCKLCYTYQNKVYLQCLKLLANKSDAEDMTQETLIKAVCNIETLTDVDKFDSWIMTIASNCCRSYMRKKRPILIASEEPDNFFEKIEDANTFSNPEQALLDSEREKIIQNMLCTLPNDQKQAIHLYYFEDKSVKEIAELLQVSEHCVRGRIRLGRKRISKQLKVLNKLDSFSYIGAAIVFEDIVKTTATKGIYAIVSSVSAKALAITMSVVIMGSCFFGIRNLSMLTDKNEENDATKATFGVTQEIECSLHDEDLPFSVAVNFDVPQYWKIMSNSLEWFGDFKNICSVYADDFTSKLDFSCKIRRSKDKNIMHEADVCISVAETMLNERNITFERIEENIAISVNKRENFSRYFAVVKANIPENSYNAFSGYFYMHFAVDVCDQDSFNENLFIQILRSVDFNLIAHKNALWFDRYNVSRFAFDVTEDDMYIGKGANHVPMKNTYSIYDEETNEIVSLICNMKVDTVVSDQTQAHKDYVVDHEAVTVGGFSFDRTFYTLDFVANFYESGLVVIYNNNNSMYDYYICEDAKEIYNAILKFKSEGQQ